MSNSETNTDETEIEHETCAGCGTEGDRDDFEWVDEGTVEEPNQYVPYCENCTGEDE